MDNEIKDLPEKYKPIWNKCIPLLEMGRAEDVNHAKEVVETILRYSKKIKMDLDVLIPTAMMHDIGHSGILPEHFDFIAGPKKIRNAKLVHMLVGAKIAHDILTELNYNKKKIQEIVEIIAYHDYDQIEGFELNHIYNTDNKRVFHDLDSLDRYNERRFKEIQSRYKTKEDRENVLKKLEQLLENFYNKEIKTIAKEGLDRLKKLANG